MEQLVRRAMEQETRPAPLCTSRASNDVVNHRIVETEQRPAGGCDRLAGDANFIRRGPDDCQ
jgi:hypothetical protein